jgi:hypothetical protein
VEQQDLGYTNLWVVQPVPVPLLPIPGSVPYTGLFWEVFWLSSKFGCFSFITRQSEVLEKNRIFFLTGFTGWTGY